MQPQRSREIKNSIPSKKYWFCITCFWVFQVLSIPILLILFLAFWVSYSAGSITLYVVDPSVSSLNDPFFFTCSPTDISSNPNEVVQAVCSTMIPVQIVLISVFGIVLIVFTPILIITALFGMSRMENNTKFNLKKNWTLKIMQKVISDLENGEYPVKSYAKLRNFHSAYTGYGTRYEVNSSVVEKELVISNLSVKSIKIRGKPFENLVSNLLTVVFSFHFATSVNVNNEISERMNNIIKDNTTDKYTSFVQGWTFEGLDEYFQFAVNGPLDYNKTCPITMFSEGWCSVISCFCCCFPNELLVWRKFKKVVVDVDIELVKDYEIELKIEKGMKLKDVISQLPYTSEDYELKDQEDIEEKSKVNNGENQNLNEKVVLKNEINEVNNESTTTIQKEIEIKETNEADEEKTEIEITKKDEKTIKTESSNEVIKINEEKNEVKKQQKIDDNKKENEERTQVVNNPPIMLKNVNHKFERKNENITPPRNNNLKFNCYTILLFFILGISVWTISLTMLILILILSVLITRPIFTPFYAYYGGEKKTPKKVKIVLVWIYVILNVLIVSIISLVFFIGFISFGVIDIFVLNGFGMCILYFILGGAAPFLVIATILLGGLYISSNGKLKKPVPVDNTKW